MPVFISHKREDTTHAVRIQQHLMRSGVAAYIDVLDPSLKTTDDITETLMQRVKACSHIMAVVSEYTTQSWWVPFEIGVASELDRRVTTYQLSSVALPDFLKKWPVLKNPHDLDIFIQHYQLDSSVPRQERMYTAANIGSGADFHRRVKAALFQQ